MATPFDLGSPPADLPSGSTNLPYTQSHEEMVAEIRTRGPTGREDFQRLSEQDKATVVKYWSKLVFTYMDSGLMITNCYTLLEHVKKHKRELEKGEPKDPNNYIAWTEDCAARNNWIESKRMEWKKRIGLKRAAVAQWDAYIDEAHLDYQNAKATPAPPRPR